MVDFKPIREKFIWAKYRRNNLERSIRFYMKRNPIEFKSQISDDRLSWQVKAVVKRQPPLQKWAFWHAEIVHDYRSILDNSVWSIAHSAGSPRKPVLLEFPIVVDASKWHNSFARISELPQDYKDVIEKVQPFNLDAQDPVGSALRLVHELDIQNKHHSPIITSVCNPQEYRNNFQIIYKEQPLPTENSTVEVHSFRYEDGLVVWDQKVPRPIEKIDIEQFTISAIFVINDEKGVQYPLLGALDHISSGCDLILKDFESLK